MKFKEYLKLQNESYSKIIEWIENEDLDNLNEDEIFEKLSFPLIKYTRIKIGIKKIRKAEVASAMETVNHLVLKKSEKWQKMKDKEVADEGYKTKKKAMEDQITTLKAKLDNLAGSNDFLKKLASWGKLSAKSKANDIVIKKAKKVMSDSMSSEYQKTQKKIEKNLQKATAKMKAKEAEAKEAEKEAAKKKKGKIPEETPEETPDAEKEKKEKEKKAEKVKALKDKLEGASDEDKESIKAEIAKLEES